MNGQLGWNMDHVPRLAVVVQNSVADSLLNFRNMAEIPALNHRQKYRSAMMMSHVMQVTITNKTNCKPIHNEVHKPGSPSYRLSGDSQPIVTFLKVLSTFH